MLKRYGDWIVLEELGAGGQGRVYRGRRIPEESVHSLNARFREATGAMQHPDIPKGGEVLTESYDLFAKAEQGAIKVLHGLNEAKNPKTCRQRFELEVTVLKELNNSALIRLLDANLERAWFVMEYHAGGTLSRHMARFKGDVLGAAMAFRPLVSAVAELHKKKVVHRDIKPDNIFIADDGRLVLGDFGLVYLADSDETRLTGTYENIGSWQWMPTWAQGMRIEEVPPAFDTFTLGKVLWAMISGKTFLRSHYFRDAEFNLENLFPDDSQMSLINNLLDTCIVERKDQGVVDASEMLLKIDALLELIGAMTCPCAKLAKLAKLLFPGKWRNRWKHADGTSGDEAFTIDEAGYYVMKGKRAFATRLLCVSGPNRVVLEKKSLHDDRILIEDIRIEGENRRVCEDGRGGSVVYTKIIT